MNVLSNDTRKIIDDARDTLVGQIPVPMMQCQQITLALTYKFMSDDDQRAERLGGERHYFAGDLEPYGWDKIMSLRLDDTQRSELYRAGISTLQESDSMPAVFREIFKDAVVPFGDHRTLALFLSTMDRMVYDDSEKLGDAYEYLLKTAEAQADAGQFRTPRHIIDFIVKIIDPQKHEVIIDPACGTAGFLVSAYQHVRSQHEMPGGGSSLSVPDLTRLADNLKGYDISPEMTKLAMANMYLHTQDKNPNIDNYDTLTSTDHWNEYADVMLANPPFMTPKGGIRPHSRFRVSATKAEVLFVDYIASHLNEYGRAGIIVPEGIVFQSQNAYKQLRRFLLDESLVAVISLPGGVFNPYSGVKTSILILDKVLAPKTDCVAFFKVENDGYSLGTQRRPIGKDDLPAVTEEIYEYLRRLRKDESLEDYQSAFGHVVARSDIAADGEYNLSGERYREHDARVHHFPMVPLGQIAELIRGVTFRKGDQLETATNDSLRVATTRAAQESGIVEEDLYHIPMKLVKDDKKMLQPGDILISTANSLNLLGRTTHVQSVDYPTSFGAFMSVIRPNKEILDTYLLHVLRTEFATDFFRRNANTTTNISNLNISALAKFEIPLPPLEVQRELVSEIESYQRVLDGARAVVDNWRPQFVVSTEWPTIALGDVCTLIAGQHIDKDDYNTNALGIGYLTGPADFGDVFPEFKKWTTTPKVIAEEGDVLIAVKGSGLGKVNLLSAFRAAIGRQLMAIRATGAITEYLYIQLMRMYDDIQALGVGAAIPGITKGDVLRLRLPLPPLTEQESIVATWKREMELVNGNRELVERMEQRIQDAIVRVWEG